MLPRNDGRAIASMVLGIIAVCLVWIPVYGWGLAIILGILAIVFGVVSRKAIQESGGRLTGNGMAVAGLVLGIVSIVIAILWIAFLAAIFGVAANEAANNAAGA